MTELQIAIAKFFDGEGPDPVAEAMAQQDIPRVAARHENLQESLLAADRPIASRPRPQTDPAPRIVPSQPITHGTPWLFSIVFMPFTLGWRIASGLWRSCLYIFSFLPAPLRSRAVSSGLASGFRSTNGRRMLMPRDTAARFRREFDEEYGVNELPFYEGGIAQAHDLAKKEVKFMLVIIMSPEHDDTESFVRDTLLAPEVVQFIKDPAHNIILWGGNVLDSEAYQVAAEYNCTKFPFSALVCLTPKEGSTRMGIVKRLVGPMPASTYVSELQSAIDKYGVDLTGVRAERTAQEVARTLRNEQDSAYERSLAMDRERAREKKEAAAVAAAAEKRALEEAEAAAQLAEKRKLWRQWRATTLRAEPPATEKQVTRVALMMPEETGAGRVIRRFAQDAPVEELYAFVDCYEHISGGAEGANTAEGVAAPRDYEHKYMFRIVSTLPREVYEPSKTATMGETIGRSGNLIVEELIEGDDEEGQAEET